MAFPLGVENRVYVTAFNLQSGKDEQFPFAEFENHETARKTMIFRGHDERSQSTKWYVMSGHLTSNTVVFDMLVTMRRCGRIERDSDGIVRFIADFKHFKPESPSYINSGKFDGDVDCLIVGNGDVYFPGGIDQYQYRQKAMSLNIPCVF